MIRNVHVQYLRDQMEQAERDLAGWRYLLGQAEQGERAGTVMPDPLMPAGTPWPAPLAEPWPHPPEPVRRRDPYAGPALQPIDGSTLPPNQEAALSVVASEHDAYAQSRDGVKEEQKWGSA